MAGMAELEREVLHRLEMASKNPDYSEVLFKMTLINMSSYHVASQKYTGKFLLRYLVSSQCSNEKQRPNHQQHLELVIVPCV
jgi:hypothetical protein